MVQAHVAVAVTVLLVVRSAARTEDVVELEKRILRSRYFRKVNTDMRVS